MERQFHLRTLMGVVFVVGILLGSCLWLHDHAVRQASESACSGNLVRISHALMAYNDFFGTLPPAYTVDRRGRRLHSWRVLLLPFLDRSDLYRKFALDEPWDSRNNAGLLAQMPGVYRCPNDLTARAGTTSYVVAVGSTTAFPGEHAFSLRAVKRPLSELALVAELRESQIPWTAPNDLDLDKLGTGGLALFLMGAAGRGDLEGPGVARADCTVVRWQSRSPSDIAAMFLVPQSGRLKRDEQ